MLINYYYVWSNLYLFFYFFLSVDCNVILTTIKKKMKIKLYFELIVIFVPDMENTDKFDHECVT